MIDSSTETPGRYRQLLQVGPHALHADLDAPSGGDGSAPTGHDYFDAALAACKTLTATFYAKKNGFPLERVESRVERDASKEREGVYRLKVRLAFHGPLTDEQRTRLYNAVAKCPVHKLMTTTEVIVDTEPL
ncbi:MAG: OsmC family protein [Myxococcaceae bacterium]|nr:OsmC family protein [Myxococcaceae bacterium]